MSVATRDAADSRGRRPLLLSVHAGRDAGFRCSRARKRLALDARFPLFFSLVVRVNTHSPRHSQRANSLFKKN